jgi:hypothetical protein
VTLKRYVLLSGDAYQPYFDKTPYANWYDFRGSFDTKTEAETVAQRERYRIFEILEKSES